MADVAIFILYRLLYTDPPVWCKVNLVWSLVLWFPTKGLGLSRGWLWWLMAEERRKNKVLTVSVCWCFSLFTNLCFFVKYWSFPPFALNSYLNRTIWHPLSGNVSLVDQRTLTDTCNVTQRHSGFHFCQRVKSQKGGSHWFDLSMYCILNVLNDFLCKILACKVTSNCNCQISREG